MEGLFRRLHTIGINLFEIVDVINFDIATVYHNFFKGTTYNLFL